MKRKLFFILLFLVTGALGAVYIREFFSTRSFSWPEINAAFISMLLLGASILLAAHVLRAYKSRYLLLPIRPARTRLLFKGLSVGYLFNALLPFRLGEIIRAFYVGEALAISKTTVFISIVIERVIDGFILGSTFVIAAILIRSQSETAFSTLGSMGLGLWAVAIILTLVILILRSEQPALLRGIHGFSALFNTSLSNRMRFIAWSGIYGTRLMLHNKHLWRKYLSLSIGMWALYFVATICLVLAFFSPHQLEQVWYIVQSTFAGFSVPAGPGYIKTFDSVTASLLGSINVTHAASFTFIVWLVSIVPISTIGLYVLARQRFGESKTAEKQAMLINKLHREQDVSEELGNFLDAYLKGERLNKILTQAELDEKFRLIKAFKGGSNAHTMLVWQNDELRVKKITLIQYADKLQDQADWLLQREHLPHLPKVIHQEKTDHYYYFDLAYREDFSPFFEYIHHHTTQESFTIMKKVMKFMNTSVYLPKPAKNGRENLDSYIEGKVLGKVNDTSSMDAAIGELLSHPTLIINGVKYDNVLQIIRKIKRHKTAMKELSDYSESPIHGDLTVDNLIASAEGDFLVIDPNNENQVSAPVVDYGKLYQSLHSGYEFLIQLERCSVNGNRIDFEDARSQKYAEIFSSFDTKLKHDLSPAEYRSILFHEAVHYCRMLTYRVGINPKTTAVFYGTAVKLFNEFLLQYEKRK